MSLFDTSAMIGFYKSKETRHLPQPSWKWHQLAPACLLLTEGLSRHSQWWCQPERQPPLHHSYATISHISSDNQSLYQCEMTTPVYEHLVIQASQQAPDQSLPSHLQVLKISYIFISHIFVNFFKQPLQNF